MTVTHGFWNSLAGDRTYDAEEMSRLFTGIVEDGIFSNIGTNLIVVADGVTMTLLVGEGRAWFNETWTDNDAALSVLVPTAGVVYDRIDAVVLEVDKNDSTRANTIKVISGVEASSPVKPTLETGPNVFQYPLCYITVASGVTLIDPVDLENTVGTTEAPYIIGALQTVSIDDTLSQWYAEFDIWFEGMKDQLSVDAAGNLQIQIDELGDRENRLNKIVNGGMQIAQQGDTSPEIIGDGYPTGGPDLAFVYSNSIGGLVCSREEQTFKDHGFSHSLRLECVTAEPTLLAGANGRLSFKLSGMALQNAKKGLATAESFAVSFLVQSNLTGLFNVELLDLANSRHVVSSFTIAVSDTPQIVDITFVPDYIGEFSVDDIAALTLSIWLAAGSDFSSGVRPVVWSTTDDTNRCVDQVNLVGVVGNYIEITSLGLYIGELAPTFKHNSYFYDKAAVREYIWYGKFDHDGAYRYGITGASYYGAGAAFISPMRSSPSTSIVVAPVYASCSSDGIYATKYGIRHRVNLASNTRYRIINGEYLADSRL